MAKKTPKETTPKKVVSHLKVILEIGNKVYQARKEKKWSQKELAAKSGLSSMWINQLEKGEKENASVKSLYEVCEALGLQLTFSC